MITMRFEQCNDPSDLHDFLTASCHFTVKAGFEPVIIPGNDHVYVVNDAGDTMEVIFVDDVNATVLNEKIKELTVESPNEQYQMIVQDDFNKVAVQRARPPHSWGIKQRCRLLYNAGSGKEDTKASIIAKFNSLENEVKEPGKIFNEFFDTKPIVDKFYKDYEAFRKKLAKKFSFPVPVDDDDRDEYATVVMNRIMFVYFLQVSRKESPPVIEEDFLEKLHVSYLDGSESDVTSFFQCLCKLWFDYLNNDKERSTDDGMFEGVPYLNGGLFSYRDGIELDGTKLLYGDISIPDATWTKMFKLFNKYEWTIVENDEKDDEMGISPSILGHIYEKQCNQKESGAYYTPDHVTTYIARSCIFPLITDRVNKKFKVKHANFIDEILDKKEIGSKEIEEIEWAYFNVITRLTICDNACGSGAFLLAAGKILVDIYEKCLEWIRPPAGGSVAPVPGAGRDEIKRYIMTRNLYGVDIQDGSVEIAKLRLWLSMISDMVSGDVEPLPNIDYNLLSGNTLIGYTSLPRNWGKSLLSNPAVLKSKLDEYRKLKNSYRDVKKSVKSMDYKQKIDVIRSQVRDELDAMIGADLAISRDEVDALKPFHWAFDFENVFSKGGFDVIIGNPPYIRADTENDLHLLQRKTLLKSTAGYKTLYEKWDVFIAFIERSLRKLVKKGGYFGYIVSDAVLTVKYASKCRDFMTSNNLKSVDFFKKVVVFRGVGVNPTIIIASNAKQDEPARRMFRVGSFNAVKKTELVDEPDGTTFRPQDTSILEMIDRDETEKIGNICYVSYGLRPNADENKAKGLFDKGDVIFENRKTNTRPYIEAKDYERYKLKRIKFLEWGTARCPSLIARKTFPQLYTGKKIISGKVCKGSILDDSGILGNDSTIIIKPFKDLHGVNNRSIKSSITKWHGRSCTRSWLESVSSGFCIEYILCILNSSFINSFLNAIRKHKNPNNFYPDEIKEVPIKKGIEQSTFIPLASYLQFLYVVDEKKAIRLDSIVNDIVTGLYVGKEISDDGTTPLLATVKKFAKEIDFSGWSLLRRKKLIGTITDDEEDSLSTEKNRLLNEVSGVLESIESDNDVKVALEEMRENEITKQFVFSLV
jgi:type I restriction-modification system DNA methylase subunit